MTTKQLGNIGEAKVLAKLIEMTIPIFVAFGDNEKCDLIAEFNGKLNKIQVKSSEKFKDDKITISLVSCTKNKKHKYTKEEIDYFAIYNHEANIILLLPIEKFEGRTELTFRIPFKKSTNQYESFN